MKQQKSIREAGPYYVTSHSQGRGIVYFQIYPAFPLYDGKDGFQWAESRYGGQGGGPSIFTSIGTARVLAEWLNSVYPDVQVVDWESRIKAILDEEGKAFIFVECRTCHYVSSAKKDWNYCPVCGNRFKKEDEKENHHG